jgi:hypothetical protein
MKDEDAYSPRSRRKSYPQSLDKFRHITKAIYKHAVNGMSTREVTGNKEVKIVAKQTENEAAIQRKGTTFCSLRN